MRYTDSFSSLPIVLAMQVYELKWKNCSRSAAFIFVWRDINPLQIGKLLELAIGTAELPKKAIFSFA